MNFVHDVQLCTNKRIGCEGRDGSDQYVFEVWGNGTGRIEFRSSRIQHCLLECNDEGIYEELRLWGGTENIVGHERGAGSPSSSSGFATELAMVFWVGERSLFRWQTEEEGERGTKVFGYIKEEWKWKNEES
ncbi:hypothetical protein C2S51_033296 [Perilla frutescens var. frutescens]|nr:hypothetical protein C2S51_033296 [Perilla frutescens var. frutescens]